MDPGDSKNVTFIQIYFNPVFSNRNAGMLGCNGVKFGLQYIWIIITFLESSGSIHYCYVFGFLGTSQSPP